MATKKNVSIISPVGSCVVHGNSAFITAAATCWDEIDGPKGVSECPGKVFFKSHRYFFSTNTNPSKEFPILYDYMQNTSDCYPCWILNAKNTVDVTPNFPFPANKQARFAAKYLIREYQLSDIAKYNIKILGTAYFEHSDSFSFEHCELLRKALVFYLKT